MSGEQEEEQKERQNHDLLQHKNNEIVLINRLMTQVFKQYYSYKIIKIIIFQHVCCLLSNVLFIFEFF